MIKRIHVKTPSEHTIDLGHRAIELQFEGCLNLKHSLLKPGPASRRTLPNKLFVAILVDAGTPSAFFQAVIDTIDVANKYAPTVKEPIPEKKVSFYDLVKFNDVWDVAPYAM